MSDAKRIFVFAYNEKDKPNPSICYKGYYDGKEFIPKTGFCSSVDELYDYDYVQLFGNNGCQKHTPKIFNNNLLRDMRSSFKNVYGYDDQMNLFDD